ncbi:hypothetical protein Tco_0893735 [Tanacetum coccineum]|uniref:Reverse transcriptase domain-containing protein n=1 Tax=Tanacetum coccineum TaxID=301880 RepID=A0ABQ5CB13_9ASTR
MEWYYFGWTPVLSPNSSSSKDVEQDPKMTMDQIPEQNPHQPPIPYPSRLNKDKLQDKSDIQIHKFLLMFKKLHFNISFAESLAQMPKYAKMLKYLLTNKEKLLELANTPLNENCSAVLHKKLPKKLGDPRKFLIPCDFSELEECLSLVDLGANINLMPLFVWKKLMLPELIPTHMTLELANRFVFYPVDIAEDVFVQVVDVYREELTLRVSDEKSIFNVESTLKYPHKHGDDPTPSFDPIVVSLSPSLTPFRDSEFLLEETTAFLALDDSIPSEINNEIYDSEGDILFPEKLLNDNPTKDLPPKELKNDETKMTKSLIEEPPKLELKDLPPHLEYSFLEGTLKLPVIITKDLKREEKYRLNSSEGFDDLVPIPKVFEKPLDSLDLIIKTFDMTITNPLFDFDSEFTLNSDNPIFDIQNEESDESETKTVMQELQIHSSQSTAQTPPPYRKLNFDLTMPNPILTFS